MNELLLSIRSTEGRGGGQRCVRASGNFEETKKIQDESKMNYVKTFLVEHVSGKKKKKLS